MDRWPAVLAALVQMRSLKDDWDGEGTLAPESTVIDAAMDYAKLSESSLAPVPDRVHVGVNGTIYFEWDWLTEYCEVEVVSSTQIEIRYVDKTKVEASHV